MKKTLCLVLGPALLALCVLGLPHSLFTAPQSVAVGLILWMGLWWVTLPVGPAVTALLPIAVDAFYPIVPMGRITSLYFSDIVVLLLGANIISATWSLSGLDRRLALKALTVLGTSLSGHIVVWFAVAAILSSVLPNAVVCALLTPIVLSMLSFLARQGPFPKEAGYILMVAVVWGCGLGGLGTPLGGAMNLVAISYLENLTGHEFLYINWVVRMVPVMLAMSAVTVALLLVVRPRNVVLKGSREYFAQACRELPPLSRSELLGLLLFAAPLILSFLRGFYAAWFPQLKPAHLFLVFGLLAFVVPGGKGAPMATWKQVEKNIEWSILLLFAGGLALGALLIDSGASVSISRLVTQLPLSGGLGTLALIAAGTMVFSEVASNTAAAAIAVPIVIAVAQALGLDPVGYVFVAAAAFNTGFMFPTSIRAIPVAYGLDPGYLMRCGAAAALVSIGVIALAGALLLV